ncbi:MAG TPA: hypothetical protein VGR03_14020 [Candidatus Acidoferrum sp.]|nr:hypothetical protein [Candidatus Acidoferrum sp.]
MRLDSQDSPYQFRRSTLFVFGFLVFFVVVAYKTAGYVIVGDMTGLAFAAMAFVGCAFIVAMLNNWRNGVYFFLTWLLFEDFARKYLGNNMAIYFAKDVLAAVVYLSFFLAYRRKEVTSFRPPFLVPVLIFVWFGVMQVFNPASTNLMYGVLGLKLFFYYVPLLFVGYALLNSEAELRRFFFVNMILALIIISLGIAQAIIGHTFLNPEIIAADIRDLSTLYRVSPISGLIMYRPTSVFVSTGRFGNFLLVTWLLVFGFSGYLLLRHKRGRALAFIVLALTVAGLALCSSRGVVLWSSGSALVGSAAFVWGAPWRQREVMRVLRSVQRTALGIALGIVVLLATYPEALLSRVAFYTETLSPSSSASELQHRTWDYPLTNFLGAFGYERWIYGYGIGTTSLGTQYVARIFGAKPPVTGVESGFGTLVIEMGIGGLVLWFVMSFAILFAAWRVVKKLRGSPWFPLAFVIFWYAGLLFLPMTFSGIQAYEDFVLNAYLWLLLGVLFRLPTLAVSAQFAATAQLSPMYDPRIRMR